MKKIIRLTMLGMVMLFGSLAHVSAAASLPDDGAKDAAMYSHIVTRVNEIQAMDKTNLSFSEKASLRKELKKMKKEATGLSSKVYLSVGAIIIIILILILILK